MNVTSNNSSINQYWRPQISIFVENEASIKLVISSNTVLSTMSVIYVGNLDERADSRDLRDEFDRYGHLKDVWIARNPPGFAFIEFDSERDAKDAVRDMDGRYILDKRVRVEISRRSRASVGDRDSRETRGGPPQRSEFRVKFSNLPERVGWRDLKDYVRKTADPIYADITGGGKGVADFRSLSDAELVVDKLDDVKFEGSYIRVTLDTASVPAAGDRSTRDRSRSRSRSRDRVRRDRSRSR
jgi:RNA recognition motif-containing protein